MTSSGAPLSVSPLTLCRYTWRQVESAWIAGECLLALVGLAAIGWVFPRVATWLAHSLHASPTSSVMLSLPFFTLLAVAGGAVPLFGLVGFLVRHGLGPALMRRTGWDVPLFTWVATHRSLPAGPLREWVRACGDAPSDQLLRTLPLDTWTALLEWRAVWRHPTDEVVRLLARLDAAPSGASGSPQAVPALVRVALAYPDREVRAAALCWIGRRGPSGRTPPATTRGQ